MAMIPISTERMAQLEEFAHRRGQNTATALDTALAEYLSWEERDFQQAVQAITEGYSQLRDGLAQPAEEAFEELRLKHDLPH